MKFEYSYLIIEDSKKVCEGIRERMEAFPEWKACAFAFYVEDAIEIIDTERPALIFLDWSLKGGNAYDVLQFIQNTASYDPYIIFNTGFQNENPEIPEQIINNYQVDKYIVKPVFENFRLHLSTYVREAAEKAADTRQKKNAVWLEDVSKIKRKVALNQVVCICQHPADPRSRMVYLHSRNEYITIPHTWEACINLLVQHQISFFVAKSRESIVVKEYIQAFEKPFIRLRGKSFKVGVTKDKIKEFEQWLVS